MHHHAEKQFLITLPSPYPYDLVFEFDCVFTFVDDTHVILQTRDIALGEKTFKYKDCGDTTKNMLYAWHLCAYAALAYALKLAVMDAETGDKSAEVGDNDCG